MLEKDKRLRAASSRMVRIGQDALIHQGDASGLRFGPAPISNCRLRRISRMILDEDERTFCKQRRKSFSS